MEKSIEQHLHANERGCCCFVMRACKRFDINLHEAICQSHTPLWATRGGGAERLFCKDGVMTLVNELSVHFPLN